VPAQAERDEDHHEHRRQRDEQVREPRGHDRTGARCQVRRNHDESVNGGWCNSPEANRQPHRQTNTWNNQTHEDIDKRTKKETTRSYRVVTASLLRGYAAAYFWISQINYLVDGAGTACEGNRVEEMNEPPGRTTSATLTPTSSSRRMWLQHGCAYVCVCTCASLPLCLSLCLCLCVSLSLCLCLFYLYSFLISVCLYWLFYLCVSLYLSLNLSVSFGLSVSLPFTVQAYITINRTN
jgi:hypothetical protein